MTLEITSLVVSAATKPCLAFLPHYWLLYLLGKDPASGLHTATAHVPRPASATADEPWLAPASAAAAAGRDEVV
jgi:hypothetical protein